MYSLFTLVFFLLSEVHGLFKAIGWIQADSGCYQGAKSLHSGAQKYWQNLQEKKKKCVEWEEEAGVTKN